MFPSPLVRCLDRLLAATRFQPKGASLCCGGVAATPARSTRLHFIVCDLPRVVKPPGVFFVLLRGEGLALGVDDVAPPVSARRFTARVLVARP